MRTVAIIAACSLVAACGSSSSPTAASPAPASSTRIISVTGTLAFGNVQIGASAEATLTISNSGTGPLTVSAISQPAGYSASWTSGTIPAGNSQVLTIRFSPAAAQTYNGALTVNGDQTSGTNAIAVTGAGVAAAPAPASSVVVNGLVTDGTSAGILPGIAIQIADGPDAGKSARTDSAGAYSLAVAPGTFTMSLTAASYQAQSRQVAVAANSRIDFVLQRVPSLPAPAPAPVPPSISVARTFLSFVSDPGDYIGLGESHAYGLQDGSWNATFTSFNGIQHVSVSISNVSGPTSSWFSWYFDVSAPKGQPLRVGTYEAARRYPFQPDTQPGLSFYGSGRGCNELTGRFTIDAFTLGPGNTVDQFQASFDQNCEGGSKALHGQIAVLANPWR